MYADEMIIEKKRFAVCVGLIGYSAVSA